MLHTVDYEGSGWPAVRSRAEDGNNLKTIPAAPVGVSRRSRSSTSQPEGKVRVVMTTRKYEIVTPTKQAEPGRHILRVASFHSGRPSSSPCSVPPPPAAWPAGLNKPAMG